MLILTPPLSREGHQANGAFVAAGPPGFTVSTILQRESLLRKVELQGLE